MCVCVWCVQGPEQGKIHSRGNQYILEEYPLTDFIQSCRILRDDSSSPQHQDVLVTAMQSLKNDRLLRKKNLTEAGAGAGGASAGPGRGRAGGARGEASEDDDAHARNKAFTAIAVLVVAMGLLLCLYKFSTITEGKSQ